MIRVELKELQAKLDHYMKKLDEGEKIAVTENGAVIYELNEPLSPPKANKKAKRTGVGAKRRVLGQHVGWIKIPENICGPLSQEVMDLFYNEAHVCSKVVEK